ncbi:hypothetical protein Q6A77_09285 [Aliarcobacter skirrowii]|uniref:hypothetical protein n=1 Tax=Aliarcobacter skirrowii TaxID=28200 RepID=UPI0029B2ACC5|nr:hypothetical protein [Aliarcobacter skirrowii]MDX4058856.1 hypothetical protein [Aliarcobacter skirrowii]
MAIICKKCSSNNCVKAGLKKLKNNELQRYKCNDCKSFFTGYEKFHHLNDDSKSKIINSFKENKKLEDIAKENSVYLRTIQYTIKNNLTPEETFEIIHEYADFKLGNKIKDCIEEKGKCEFYAEI